jgi:hypothetical protein
LPESAETATNQNDISASDAQALKIGTYRQLKSESYLEMKSATIESQKSFSTRNLRKLADQFPEIAKLNAKEGEFL